MSTSAQEPAGLDWVDQLAAGVGVVLALRDPADGRLLAATGPYPSAGASPLLGAIHPDDRRVVDDPALLPRAGAATRLEYRVRDADGIRWVRARRSTVRHGGRTLMAELLEDVTDLHEEQVLTASTNKAKDEFLSRVSHELRTPLNAILGFGQVLKLEGLSDDQEEPIDQILRGGRHLLDLINEVLDISRIDSGNVRMSLEAVSVAEVVDEALHLVRHLGDGRSVRLPEPGQIPTELHVLADRQRLKQVVLNLLSNAVKYNRHSGMVTVTCSAADEGTVRLTVADTGVGIDAGDMGRLFTPFDRLGFEDDEVEGTGLGLTLSKRLVEAMGGSIGVDSTRGVGSSFWVELRATGNPALVTLPAEAAPAVGGLGTVLDGTVLYVEDNLSNVSLMRRILASRSGVELLVSMQASLGLELARANRPDVVLLDLHLPDLPGEEALRRLKADPATSAIPVYVVSADATPAKIERVLSGGASGYLTKPISVVQFLDIVDAHCAHPDVTCTLDEAIVDGLLELAATTGADGMADLVDHFLRSVVSGLAELDGADTATIEAVAHSLRGASSMYGAVRLSAELAALEEAARAANLAAVPAILDRVHTELEQARQALALHFPPSPAARSR